MLQVHPGRADLPLVADWARLERPVIVQRRMAGDFANGAPAALPLPPSHGKRRLAFSFLSGAGVVALPPVLLADTMRSAPEEWQPFIAALLDLGAAVGVTPRVFGALLWEHLTGLPYLIANGSCRTARE
jgi:phosphoribosyl-dephospho-CoA transferase